MRPFFPFPNDSDEQVKKNRRTDSRRRRRTACSKTRQNDREEQGNRRNNRRWLLLFVLSVLLVLWASLCGLRSYIPNPSTPTCPLLLSSPPPLPLRQLVAPTTDPHYYLVPRAADSICMWTEGGQDGALSPLPFLIVMNCLENARLSSRYHPAGQRLDDDVTA